MRPLDGPKLGGGGGVVRVLLLHTDQILARIR